MDVERVSDGEMGVAATRGPGIVRAWGVGCRFEMGLRGRCSGSGGRKG